MTPTRLPRSLTSRFGIIVAVTIGFGAGAAGLAAAQHDDPLPPTTTPATVVSAPTTVDDGPTTTVDDGPTTTVDDGPTTTVDDGPTTTIDDGPTTTIDDGPTTTVDDGPTTTIDNGPTTTIDDGPTTTTAASALPDPFTATYSSSGGSINVTWSGTAFTLNSVSPAPGFGASIEDQAWDRVRVDFEGADVDARIDVRINDGSLRVRID
jgi:hypothetical protein